MRRGTDPRSWDRMFAAADALPDDETPTGGPAPRRWDITPAVAAVFTALAILAALAVAASLSSCAMSPIGRQALAISIVADTTSGSAIAIDRAARADLHATCPTLAPECVATVRVRWATADAAIAVVAANLEAWRTAVDIARVAGTPPGPNVLRALTALAASYTAMRTLCATLHVTLPALPVEAVAALASLAP